MSKAGPRLPSSQLACPWKFSLCCYRSRAPACIPLMVEPALGLPFLACSTRRTWLCGSSTRTSRTNSWTARWTWTSTSSRCCRLGSWEMAGEWAAAGGAGGAWRRGLPRKTGEDGCPGALFPDTAYSSAGPRSVDRLSRARPWVSFKVMWVAIGCVLRNVWDWLLSTSRCRAKLVVPGTIFSPQGAFKEDTQPRPESALLLPVRRTARTHHPHRHQRHCCRGAALSTPPSGRRQPGAVPGAAGRLLHPHPAGAA